MSQSQLADSFSVYTLKNNTVNIWRILFYPWIYICFNLTLRIQEAEFDDPQIQFPLHTNSIYIDLWLMLYIYM